METSRQVTGMITVVDLTEGYVRVRDDDEAFCTLCCGNGTKILGEEESLLLAELQPGDYVRGECARAEDGKLLASAITVLRPAWRMLESPEM